MAFNVSVTPIIHKLSSHTEYVMVFRCRFYLQAYYMSDNHHGVDKIDRR